MEKQVVLDYILVPTGVVIMVGYHIWLLYQIMKHPTTTVVGLNAINRRFWVRAMMEDTLMTELWQDVPKNGILAVQTLRNNIMASTLLASMAIMLSSLIAVLMTNGGHGSPGSIYGAPAQLVYGDRSDLGSSIKFFSILICFLVAFLMNVQSIRYYSHASILINVPFKKMMPRHYHDHHDHGSCNLTAEFVGRTVNKGSYFWSLGLHAFYFSFPLLMWIFGPIPMFLCCVVMVFLLYFLDITFDHGFVADASHEDED